MNQQLNPAARLWKLLQEEKAEITAIYFFAILGGLIQLTLPVGIQTIIGFVLSGTWSASLTVLVTVIVLAVMFSGIVQVNQMKVIEKVQQRIFVRYSFAFADRIPKLDLHKVDGIYLPELVNRFFETESLQKGFAKLLLELPFAVIQILFGLILLSFYHPLFILFGVLVLALLSLILRATGSTGLQTSLEQSVHKYRVAAWLEEIARLVTTFKFSNEHLHLRKADEKTINYLKARTMHFNVLKSQYHILIIFKVLITSAMLVGGVLLLINQQMNIGQFVAAEIIIITIIASIEKIITNLDSIYDVLTAVEKISKVTDKPVESTGSYDLKSATALAIEAKQLSFGYNGRRIISNQNFSIKAGDKVCIQGVPGAGKSTLLKLLTGAYKNFEGQLLVNKIPIANYVLTDLRNKMSIIFQHENIFHGTLWENMTMGRISVDNQWIIHLCERTGLQNFAQNLTLGYDTELDPTGKQLPQSVIEKILIVRALADKPSLLIMEEPWQAIEAEYRQDIFDLILSMNNTTVVVATEEEGFSRRCDQIIHLTVQEK